MEAIKILLDKFNTEYVEDYKKVWIKTKLVSSDDLLKVAEALKKEGLAFTQYSFSYGLSRTPILWN